MWIIKCLVRSCCFFTDNRVGFYSVTMGFYSGFISELFSVNLKVLGG